MNKKETRRFINRIGVVCIAVILVFVVLIARLGYLQFVKSAELVEKRKQHIITKMRLTASRGNLYDRNMTLLAKDITTSRITVFPHNLSRTDDSSQSSSDKCKRAAEIFSTYLDMEYEEVLKKISDTSTNTIVLKKGVENSTAQEIRNRLQKEDIEGVLITEDKKRCYSDSTFAPYILGFTGTDHVGLYGVEASFDETLKGQDGIQTFNSDSDGDKIESSVNIKKAPVPGNNLVLTLDSTLQYYAENAAYEAYLQNKPKRVSILLSDPNTGELLAMAAYPYYDLDDPWSLSKDYKASFGDDMKELTEGEKQLEMWKNPFSSFIYEPGSTFKMITAASALEENVVSLNSHFTCNGYMNIAGVRIKCDVYPRSHGTQNLTKAVSHSCNPAMMQIAMLMGPDTFYRYIYDFGFAQPTGINLDSEETGILASSQDVNLVNFVTLSFGQGLGVTPIQMMQGLNTVINGGELLKPQIVKYVCEQETNEVINTYDKQLVRKVISEDTSVKMRNIGKTTADDNYSLEKYRDVPLGGKTGTAQKFINGGYAKGRYVASFYGFAPYKNPKVSVLVIVDEPSGTYTGGAAVASPIGGEMLKKSLSYLKSREDIKTDAAVKNTIIIPDLRGKEIEDAQSILKTLGIAYEVKGGKKGLIVDQSESLTEYKKGTCVTLHVSSSEQSSVTMPNLKGMSVRNANRTLEELGLVLDAKGGGIAVKQNIEKGTKVKKGTTIKVTFQYVE